MPSYLTEDQVRITKLRLEETPKQDQSLAGYNTGHLAYTLHTGQYDHHTERTGEWLRHTHNHTPLDHHSDRRRLLTTDNATCGYSASSAIGSRLGSSLPAPAATPSVTRSAAACSGTAYNAHVHAGAPTYRHMRGGTQCRP
jgi:hypothetical protein